MRIGAPARQTLGALGLVVATALLAEPGAAESGPIRATGSAALPQLWAVELAGVPSTAKLGSLRERGVNAVVGSGASRARAKRLQKNAARAGLRPLVMLSPVAGSAARGKRMCRSQRRRTKSGACVVVAKSMTVARSLARALPGDLVVRGSPIRRRCGARCCRRRVACSRW